MYAHDATSDRFHGHDVMQVRPGVRTARGTLAVLFDRTHILCESSLLKINLPGPCQCTSKPCRSRRKHAIEHVHPEGNAHYEIGREAHPHQIPRFFLREQIGTQMHRAPELVLALPTAQSSDGKSTSGALGKFRSANPTQVRLQSSLDDRENALIVVSPVRSDTSIQPADRAVHRFLYAWSGGGRLHYVIQLHHNVRADGVLDFHAALRRQHALATIVRALELYALLGNFGQLQKGHHLETTGIGQQRPGPAHEAMQTARLFQHRRAGPHT
uniref:Uncharacterized protein n=1 Tax=Anopheles atroparvus TaxID=41427 RepID=A0AAG5CUV8_ANOAO